MLESMALKQYVNFSTHEHGHTLDLVIARSSDSIILNEPKLGPFLSDHSITNCQLNVRKAKPATKQVIFRRTKAINIETFETELLASDLIVNTGPPHAWMK
jgi:hypothetical protein